MEKINEDEEKKEIKQSSNLCKVCRHFKYCIIRKLGLVYHCELFDFLEEKDKE